MAFTATKNVPLAATTTGSWPRPAWYTQSLWGRPLDTAMLDPIYREQFSDALAAVVSDQERAGLDIVTNGDYFLDADLAGRSWHHYPLQRWRGVAFDELQPESTRSDLLKYPPGTLLNEIYTSWRWPIVTGKIQHNPRNPLEYAKIYRMTQARTRKPVKFGTVSGQVMALFLDSAHAGVPDRRQQKANHLGHGDRHQPRTERTGCRGLHCHPDRRTDNSLYSLLLSRRHRHAQLSLPTR